MDLEDEKIALTQNELISLIETTLLRTHKLNFLENIVVKITHDINNILSVMQLEMDMLSINDMQPRLDNISTLLKILQNHCRVKTPSQVCNLNDCIHSALALCYPLINKDIKLDFQLDYLIPLVSVDKIDIEQIIINAILASIQLMDVNAEKDNKKINIHTYYKNNFIHINIINNGTTKTIKEINHLTRPTLTNLIINNKDLILGISNCKKILNKYKGSIQIKAIAKNSLKFFIKIPTDINIK